MRVTTGKFLNDGEGFKIIDDHTHFENAHRNLRSGWIGTTEFVEVIDEPIEGSESVDEELHEDKNRAYQNLPGSTRL